MVNFSFSKSEHHILSLFPVGATFNYDNLTWTVKKSGKPICLKGEPKTDVYIKAVSEVGGTPLEREFKISYKKKNADFLENKTNSERAKELFGEDWSDVISRATRSIEDLFEERPNVYKKNKGKTEEGCITLGWKYELLNKKSGLLSAEVSLTDEQIVDVLSGTNLSAEKRNALVGNEVIPNSGVAQFYLCEDSSNCNTAFSRGHAIQTDRSYPETKRHTSLFLRAQEK